MLDAVIHFEVRRRFEPPATKNWQLPLDGKMISYSDYLLMIGSHVRTAQRRIALLKPPDVIEEEKKEREAATKKREAEAAEKAEIGRKREEMYARTEPKFLDFMRKHDGRSPVYGADSMTLSKEVVELFKKRLKIKVEKDGDDEFYVMAPPFEPWKPPAAVGEVIPPVKAAEPEPEPKKPVTFEGSTASDRIPTKQIHKGESWVIAGNTVMVSADSAASWIQKDKDGRYLRVPIELVQEREAS
jgi:hypothetical protein